MKRLWFALLLPAAALAQNTRLPVIDSIKTASGFGGFAGVAAPGSYVEIFGSNLSGSTRPWSASDFSGSAAPTALDGVTVTVNGSPAFISYVSPAQVNIEIPDEVPPGNADVVVSHAGQSSKAAALVIRDAQPGLFAPSVFAA